MPAGWTRAADESASAASLAAQVGTAPAEIESLIDSGKRGQHESSKA